MSVQIEEAVLEGLLQAIASATLWFRVAPVDLRLIRPDLWHRAPTAPL